MKRILGVPRCPSHYNKTMFRLSQMMRKYLTDVKTIGALMFETYMVASRAPLTPYEKMLWDISLFDDSFVFYAPDLALAQLNFYLHFQHGKRIHDHVDVVPGFFCDIMFLAYYKNGKLIDFDWTFFEDLPKSLDLYTHN